jgi:hypothetical protein
MWLEELAWLWLPVVAAAAVWLGRDYLQLKAQIRKIAERIDRLESSETETGDRRDAA